MASSLDLANQTAPSEESTLVHGADAVDVSSVPFVDISDKESRSSWLSETGAAGISLIVHVIVLVVLALAVVPGNGAKEVATFLSEMMAEPPLEEIEILAIELEEDLEAAKEITDALVSQAPAADSNAGSANPNGAAGGIQIDRRFMADEDPTPIGIESVVLSQSGVRKMMTTVPEGTLGDARAIVGDYQEALDRITQEIMWMLEEDSVLVIWCFDQSESMKDDQREIAKRIDRIYQELGLLQTAEGDRLKTAVTSYGEGFVVHTEQPTSDLVKIREAIDAVPVDPSGIEYTCQAVGNAIAKYRSHANRRQLALILVTDESGDSANNRQYLEPAIQEARSAKCRVYTLGREAVFGYPKAYMKWQNPQTLRVHWLPVDRGPETGFVEQLQTNGFRRRADAFSSGFGPYEQARLSRETGGVFFMLPTVEQALVGSVKRRYRLDEMHAYYPDLRARINVIADRDLYPIRQILWQIIADLDPWNSQAKRVIELQITFSPAVGEFIPQSKNQIPRAVTFLQYLQWAEKMLVDNRELLNQEISLRWQGNYDLMLAQVVAYQARLVEYGAALQFYSDRPPTAPATRGNTRLVNWDIHLQKELRAEAQSRPIIDRAMKLFELVNKNHPGTPWAARSQWEMKRRFGVRLEPDYEPVISRTAGASPIPVPKL